MANSIVLRMVSVFQIGNIFSFFPLRCVLCVRVYGRGGIGEGDEFLDIRHSRNNKRMRQCCDEYFRQSVINNLPIVCGENSVEA